ncbi:acylphosphatase [Candidatus Woesearchaeota archaeon]|nr:acylphosphatase [Candidatus Woesearchaeota archaeon]
MKRFHLLIKGRVQMVGFRYFTRKKAQELGVNGWIKNLPDGNVEAVIEGEDIALSQLVEYCKQGPLLAHVQDINIKEEKYQGEWEEFSIKF